MCVNVCYVCVYLRERERVCESESEFFCFYVILSFSVLWCSDLYMLSLPSLFACLLCSFAFYVTSQLRQVLGQSPPGHSWSFITRSHKVQPKTLEVI